MKIYTVHIHVYIFECISVNLYTYTHVRIQKVHVAGAKAHEISSEVTESASLRKLVAKHVHGMMVCVLKARMAEEARLCGAQAAQDDTDDRGSDAGVCMCMECAGVEALHVSDNELACACACHEFLKDECDEGPGTYHGPVQ